MLEPLLVIHIQDLELSYQGKKIFDNFSTRIRPGALVAITGPNGAGKSTLLKAILGNFPVGRGKIDLHGLVSSQIAYMPQDTPVDLHFPIDVQSYIALGALPRLGLFGNFDTEFQERVKASIESVGLAEKAESNLCALSGGQMQRAAFARVLLQDAKLLLLDEPFSKVDRQVLPQLLKVIQNLHKQGVTIVLVIHGIQILEELNCEVIELRQVTGKSEEGNWGQHV